MTRSADYVALEVGGERLHTWTTYSVDSDLLRPADEFHLTVEVGTGADQVSQDEYRGLRQLLAPGSEFRLYVGDDITGHRQERYLQMTGRIDDTSIDNSRAKGTVIQVTGRDIAGHLVDSSTPVGLVRDEGTAFLDLVRAAVEPWGIEVLADGTASRDILTGRSVLTSSERLQIEEARAQGIPAASFTRAMRRRAERNAQPVDEVAGVTADPRARARRSNQLLASDVQRLTQKRAAPRAGETVWNFLERHAARLGLMLWADPRGRLVVSAPHYDQDPLYRFVRRWRNDADDPNTILSGSRRQSGADRFSEVTVYGRSRGNDVTRTAIRATVSDDAWPIHRSIVVHDNGLRTVEEAERRAQRELQARLAEADVLEYEMPNHGLGRYLYAIDTMAAVVDEITGVEASWYITRRTFTKDRSGGTSTRVRLVPSGAIQL